MVACNQARYHARCVSDRVKTLQENSSASSERDSHSNAAKDSTATSVAAKHNTDASVIDREGVAGRRTIEATKGIRPAQDTIAGEARGSDMAIAAHEIGHEAARVVRAFSEKPPGR